MKHIKKLNENQGEYLMVLHHESGDEIHFHILEISHLPHITTLIGSGHYEDLQSDALISMMRN